MIIVSFVPVLFIAIAYFHLNRRDPDCGASYSWLSKLVHPTVGWFNGWVQVAAGILFCVSRPGRWPAQTRWRSCIGRAGSAPAPPAAPG